MITAKSRAGAPAIRGKDRAMELLGVLTAIMDQHKEVIDDDLRFEAAQ